MPRRAISPEFVGRTQELQDLDAALGRACAGAPSAALIGGESGVGKSRLVDEVVARARERGARVIAGDCVDLGDGELPYAPVVAALRQLRYELDAAELETVLGHARGDIAPLVPELGAQQESRGDAPEQALLFEQLLGVLGRLAGLAPLVLVVEDLHWADRSTRDFLAFLLRNARRERLLLLGTYRTEELHRRHPLRPFLAEAERAAHVERIQLQPFTREELAAQLAGILESPPDPGLVEDLFARSEGNPFFTEELLAATQGERARRLPDSIRDALLLRIEALSEPAQDMLRVASAAGRRVSHGLLAAAAPLPEPEQLAGLREALANNVLRQDADGEAYAFRHVLLREVLYEELLPGERAPLHRALAEALEGDPALSVEAGGSAAELAFHWFAAHDAPRALEASLRAGAQAERVAAFPEANGHFERAIELWERVNDAQRPAGVTDVELLRRAAQAAHLATDHDRAAALARRALARVDDPTTAALIEERIGLYLFRAGQVDEALATFRAAAARLPDDAPSRERAMLLAAEGHTLMLIGRQGEAAVRCREALAVARAAGATDLEGSVLATLGIAAMGEGEIEVGLAQLHHARDIAAETGDHELLARAYVNLGEMLDQIGRTADGAAVALEGLEVARGHRFGGPVLAGDAGKRLLKLGRWEEADALLADAIVAGGMAGSALLEVRGLRATARGDHAAAEAILAEADRLVGNTSGAMWLGAIANARAEAALWRRRPQEAVARLDEALSETAEDDYPFYVAPLYATAVWAHADVAVAARDRRDEAAAAVASARARELSDALRQRVRGPFVPPEVERYTTLSELEARRAAGEPDADGWAELARRWDEMDRPYAAAYARWREAEAVLAQAGDRTRAETALRGAAEVAERLGAVPLLEEIDGLARRARLRLAGPEPAAPSDDSTAGHIGLTPREVDVLRLVAAGRTNREIAEELFMSPKTASVHVSRILTKLGARGRLEAANIAARIGLGD